MSDPLVLPEVTKAALRVAALARRDACDATQRAAAAQILAARSFPVAVRPGLVVAGYAPIRSEIDPTPLMESLAAQGAQLALPVIVARDRALCFRGWHRSDPLRRGPLGIPEPGPAAPELLPDIILVPLAAFDRAGHRIGYGAGYYDRTLAQLRMAKTVIAIGLAFSVQETATIPAQPHDAALDYVLTEDRTLNFRST